jgi:hypothetical protein
MTICIIQLEFLIDYNKDYQESKPKVLRLCNHLQLKGKQIQMEQFPFNIELMQKTLTNPNPTDMFVCGNTSEEKKLRYTLYIPSEATHKKFNRKELAYQSIPPGTERPVLLVNMINNHITFLK